MSPSQLERLVQAAVQLEPGQTLSFSGLGWLNPKRYAGYIGRNPETQQPVEVKPRAGFLFMADPAFLAELNGEEPEQVAFPDDWQRYFDALHPEERTHPDPTLEETRLDVVRPAWLDVVAKEIRHHLLELGSVELPGFATFVVREKKAPRSGTRKIVTFLCAGELRAATHARLGYEP